MAVEQKIRAIVTGATGMVGEGVLLECLNHPSVESVLIINRRPSELSHPKLKEIVHKDFFDISPIENQLTGYNACFFCLGVSSIGMKEPEFYEKTYVLTMHVATKLSKKNPDMVFCYISGSGTDSTEKGKRMWARVKGKTENDLMKLPFKDVYAFRPGFMKATKGQKRVLKGYKYFSWMYPIGRPLFPNFFSTIKELGLAMINVARYGYENKHVEVKDIVALAKMK